MPLSAALTNDELAVLRHQGVSHSVKPYLSIVPQQIIAAAQINQSVFPERVAELTIDNTSGDWSKAKPGMTLYIGTTAGAFDVGIYRVRGAISGSTLPIAEMNSGDSGLASLLQTKALAENQYLSLVKDVNLHAVKSRIEFDGSGTGVFYKDYNTLYAQQNQNAVPCWLNLGEHAAGWVNSSDVLEWTFTADTSVFLSETVLSYFWEIYQDADTSGIGTITVGSTSTQSITVEFDPGHYLVWCTVGLSNGAIVRACRHVFAHQKGVYEPLRVNVSSIRKTRDGSSVSLTLEPSATISNTPILSGTMCLLWEDTRWSANVPSALTRAPLWLTTASAVTTLRKLITTTFELKSTAEIIAVGQFLETATTPTTWQQAVPALMHLEFWCFYLLYYHSTVLLLHDVIFQDVRDYGFRAISEPSGSLFDQIQRGLQRLNMEMNQRHDGTLIFTRHPFVESTGDRNVRPERMTLTESDVRQVDISRVNRARVDKVELYGFVWSSGTEVAARTMAYGSTGGQGVNQPRIQDQLVLSQSELNERAGMVFTLNNQPYDRVALELARNWGAALEPAEMYFVRVDLPANVWPEGTAFNARCLMKEVNKRFSPRGAVMTTLILEVETLGVSGRTMPINLGNGQEDGFAGFEISDLGLPILDIDPFDLPVWSPWEAPSLEYEAPETEPDLSGIPLIAWGSGGLGFTTDFSIGAPAWLEKLDGNVRSVVAAVTANSDNVRLYILMDNGNLYYAAGSIGSVPSLHQALDGENHLLRIARGVTDSVVVGGTEEASAGAWEVTFDFTDGLFDFLIPTGDTDDPYYAQKIDGGEWGEWVDTSGVEARVGENVGFYHKRAQVGVDVEPMTITEVTGIYDYAIGGVGGTDRFVALTYNTNSTAVNLTRTNEPSDGTGKTIGWTGSIANVTAIGFTCCTAFNTSSAGVDSGSATLKSLTIKGTGFNPFEDKQQLRYSSDNGLSDTPSQFGIRGLETAFDVDDFNLGVMIAASNRHVWNSTGYEADDFDKLTHIPYLRPRFEVRITCIRIPYRKLASQALNNNAESLQFIYGTDGVIPNPNEADREETLWGVNFDATTRDPESMVVSNMTPVIEDAPYYVVGADALETAGANTQHILALCKPIGGGDTELLHTTDGGTTWQSLAAFDGTWVMWVVGSITRAWVGGQDGVGYVDIEAGTITDKTGDFADEVSGLPVRGVIEIVEA